MSAIRKYMQVAYLNMQCFMFHSTQIKEKYIKPVMTAAGVAMFQPVNVTCVILTHHICLAHMVYHL
jgi:uncharacterized protein YaiI (UPF0178 family)